MQIIHSTITFVLIFTTFYSFGFFISDKIYKKNKPDIFFKVLLGYIFTGTISLILHFFFKINDIISIGIIIIALFIFLLNYKKFNKNEFLLLLIIIPIVSFLFFGYSEHPIDTNMYHHPYVSYLKSEKIIIGLANVQFRFGHISFLQYVQAIVTNDLLDLISLASINIIFYICFIYFIAFKIFKTKSFNFGFIAIILLGSFLLIKFARYREYGNDLIPLIVCMYFLIQILEVNENKFLSKNDLLNISIPFVAFMFSHKISYIFTILIFLPLLKFENFEIIKKIKLNYLLLFLIIFVPWTVKNYITTSCLAYPLEFTCYSNSIFELQGMSEPSKASFLTEIWAKGFIDHPNWKELNLKDYISGYNWVGTWLNGHFIKILEITSPLFTLILVFTLYLFINKKNYFSKKSKNQKKNKYIILWFGIVIGLFIWFSKAPIFRYGSFYIISFIIISYVMILNYLVSEKQSTKIKFFKFIFLISLSFCLLKNIVRISNSDLQMFPKTVDKYNKQIVKDENQNKLKLLKAENGLCYYTNSICSHEMPKNIKVTKFKNYYILMQ